MHKLTRYMTVSYTHLDVYKRQVRRYRKGEDPHALKILAGPFS